MCACLDGAVSECASVCVSGDDGRRDERRDERRDGDETVTIDETDNPSGRGAAHLRVEAGTPNWRPDRANKPPSFQLGVEPVCMLNNDLHHCHKDSV